MSRPAVTSRRLAIAALTLSLAGCGSWTELDEVSCPPASEVTYENFAAGFFAAHCNSCHTVHGMDLPGPTVTPPVGVDLGGLVPRRRTDGELFTAIIHPNYKITARWAGGRMTSDGESRMGDYSGTMTVQQAVDLVAFLHSRYEVEPALVVN